MRFSVSILKEILPEAEFVGFSEDERFTFLNIAKPTGSLSKKIDESNVLFFPVHAENVNVEGWYDNPFDRRKYLKETVDKNPKWTFVIDSFCPDIEGKKIIVGDIFETIIRIYNYVLKKVKPRVIAVTGSVGKTTTVAMLEDAISAQYTCLRIYSKRITPLVLWSSVINFLDEVIQFVVLEMSFYRRHHIEWMTKTLPPNISVVLNIMDNHVLFSTKDKNHDVFGNMDNKTIVITINNCSFKMTPFLATRLTLYQVMAVFAVCFSIGINLELARETINRFKPKENRISRKIIKNREVVFDGEVTGPSRFLQLADNRYGKSVLIINEFGFGIDPIEPKIKGILDAFEKFYFVRISKKATIPIIFKKAINEKRLKNVLFVDHEKLMDNIPLDAVIFYHYGEYFRRNNVKHL